MKKRTLSISFFLALLTLAAWSCRKPDPDVRIVPEPAHISIEPGLVEFPTEHKIHVATRDSGLMMAARHLADFLGYTQITDERRHSGKGISLMIDTLGFSTHPEAYELITKANTVEIRGNSARGVYWGVQTLLQLLPAEGYSAKGSPVPPLFRMPALEIRDEPAFDRRGLVLDSAGTGFTEEALKRIIELSGLHKMNRLVLRNFRLPGEELNRYAQAHFIAIEEAPPGAKRMTNECNLDVYQGDPRFEPRAAEGYLTLEKLYSLDPASLGIPWDRGSANPGVFGFISSGLARDLQSLEYKLLPRLSGLAELGWSPVAVRDYEKFVYRMERHAERFDRLGYHYRVPTPVIRTERLVFTDTLLVELHNSVVGASIRLTLDGGDPAVSGITYRSPLVLKRTTRIRAVTCLKSGRCSVPVEILAELQSFQPGQNPENLTPGCQYAFYPGIFARVSDLDTAKAQSSGTVSSIRLPEGLPKSRFGLIYRGFLKIDRPAVYRFHLRSDDGARLTIGDRVVVDTDGIHGILEKSGEVALGEGFHPFTLHYFQANGSGCLEVYWTGERSRIGEERIWMKN